jgi:hypothetical protein
MHFSQRPTSYLMPSVKNMFLFERVATDALLLSHHDHTKIVFPLKLL